MKTLFPIALLILLPLVWSIGCSGRDTAENPKQMEELRRQHLERAERMRREG
jgi:hypothetical protein